MRESFLDELAESCDRIENLTLAVERSPADRESFNGLYRDVHSLKGSGGTHGIGIITAVCHQLEKFLTEVAGATGFDKTFAKRALAYVDLLRRIENPARAETQEYSAIEKDLEALRLSAPRSRKAGLIAESSSILVTSKRDGIPAWIRTKSLLARNQKLSESPAAAVKSLV